jgi:8-oxo-dGTP pyrophosphatase MutT (NUDIX family)
MSMSQPLFSYQEWSLSLETAPLPDGRKKTAVVAHRPDSVHILAFPDPKNIILLREYRPFLARWAWVVPSGRVDKETDHAVAAQRELREEAGVRAATMRHYFSLRHSETLSCINHVYLAYDLAPDPLPQDADECIEVHTLPVTEALNRLLENPVVYIPAGALGLLRYAREHPECL